MTKLQEIVKKAKALKKAYPKKYSKWTDYIKAASKSISGYTGTSKSGNKTTVHYTNAKATTKKTTAKQGKLFGTKTHKDTRSHNVNVKVVSGLAGLFDTSVIKDIDSLKKQYFHLAKKYHPDAGGTTSQFQQLQAEYEKLLNSVLKGSNLTSEQKSNELELDKAMREIIDILAGFTDVDIKLVGKWLWMRGNSLWLPSVRPAITQAGAKPIKKDNIWYFVYKGVETKSKGGTSMEDIIKKYGAKKVDVTIPKSIKGLGSITSINKAKLKKSLGKLMKALDRRPI